MTALAAQCSAIAMFMWLRTLRLWLLFVAFGLALLFGAMRRYGL